MALRRSLQNGIWVQKFYEYFKNSLNQFKTSWSSQHEMIEKLNMQAILSASSHETEYVKDSLITFEKVSIFKLIEFYKRYLFF